mmetsp:Transcript_935/g.2584  ORF Transcript_935/g.2584 Transcript_935/m.2584 type:complete len:116 (-) Transcript_935:172-519(-)
MCRPLSGSAFDIEAVKQLWHLCAGHVQAAPGSEAAARIERHLRSIAWGIFFAGSKAALLHNYAVVEHLASQLEEEDLPSGENGEHDHIGGNVLREYRAMAVTLDIVWDRLGSWVS